MPTILYLVRHGATAANLFHPPRLQGRRHDPPLAPLGIRQAEAARDALASQLLRHCYCSPLLRAIQTAAILAQAHGLTAQPLDALVECDVGRWEGLTWDEVRTRDADAYRLFRTDPAAHGYPEGESFQQVHSRVAAALDELLTRHEDQSFAVVAHHVVNRVYLAGLLGWPARRARHLSLANGAISTVVREGSATRVQMLQDVSYLRELR